ncbi:hypothetical protein UA08_06270 [Talaromyces atroroseus]|uniref:Checkpoint protein RAD24-like helical bundle domain-containing protein n=1 Tax=Talaromyces atroroseus TaxID=1441469 RepID=A0A225AU90_TALAT|nr:hypothetical protein UA08_06270 [Talaromyces atroroseus]OKL58506.1 hypothetical protein UA08_06270 [Talaromyces atroroseus]
MAAPPPAKRQRKLVVLPSSSDNEETTRPTEAETYARSATVSSKTANTTCARHQQQQQPPQKAVEKTKKSVPPSRSLHSFFQPATEEQRWSFHRSGAKPQGSSFSSSSFLDELEEDRIEDDDDDDDHHADFDLGFSEEVFEGISTQKRKGGGHKLPARASSKRFILDGIGDTNTKVQPDVATSSAEEKIQRKPWSEQYAPVDVTELAVHKKKVDDVRNWLVAALSGWSRNKILVLHGPAGCGKTSTISLLRTVLHFDIVEWRSPFGGDAGNGQYASLSAQFDDFLSQLNGFGGLALTDSTSSNKATKQTLQKRVVLIEEFPASLSRGSVALSSFQASLRRYLASSLQNSQSIADSTPPIVIVISEAMLGTSVAMSENLTAHRLLGPEVYANPATTIIEFNPIAPTFMLKALQLVLKKEARHSMRQRIPGIGVLQRFSELGDIRSAISSLEFLCLRADKSVDWGGRVAAKAKSSSRRTAEIPLTAMEKESLELITQRESSLGLFHAVGKVVYNKRDENGADLSQNVEVHHHHHHHHVAPPRHLQHLDRPKVSQVSVEDMMDKTGTDVHTFVAALHENYPPSCDGSMFAETLEACIENLSDSDILGSEARSSSFSSRSGVGAARGRFLGYGASIDRLRQDEISFHVAVRGMLFSLPFPVRRSSGSARTSSSSSSRVGGPFKMYFPTSQRLWKDIEEVEGLVSLWERQLLSDASGIWGQKLSAPGHDLGVASWKSNALNASMSHTEDRKKHANVVPSAMPREDMLLHYLPYLSKIMGRDTSTARGLDRITQFNGIDALKREDDDDMPAEAEAANDWSTDSVLQPAGFQHQTQRRAVHNSHDNAATAAVRSRARIATENNTTSTKTTAHLVPARSPTVQHEKPDRNNNKNNNNNMASRIADEKGPEEEIGFLDDESLSDDAGSNSNADWRSVVAGVVCSALPRWFDAGVVGLLIFGGCCGNVFALEAIIKDEPAAGPLITFVQFATVSLFTIPSFLSWSAGPSSLFLKAPVIPLKSWVIYTIFFVTVNLLNNWAFAYRISVPLHIILRSGGPTASMIIGYLYNGRRYSRMQIFSVMLLTLGVVAAALADAKAQGNAITLGASSPGEEGKSTLTFITGFTILALAMLLSAFQGVYADRLYATHGNTHWREALLYSHMLSLPFFLPTYAQLSAQFRAFMASPSMLSDIDQYSAAASVFLSQSPQDVPLMNNHNRMNSTIHNATMALSHMAASLSAVSPSAAPITPSPFHNINNNNNSHISTILAASEASAGHLLNALLAKTPSKIFYLLINALTQYICIRGVYLLAAKSSSLTVTIVLNIRKLVSLLLSIYIFGNSLASGVLIGAGFVFLGGALYGVGSARAKAKNSMILHHQQQQDEGRRHRRRILDKVSSGYTSLREKSPRRRKVKV